MPEGDHDVQQADTGRKLPDDRLRHFAFGFNAPQMRIRVAQLLAQGRDFFRVGCRHAVANILGLLLKGRAMRHQRGLGVLLYFVAHFRYACQQILLVRCATFQFANCRVRFF